MAEKPTYKQLEQKVKELEQTATELKSLKAQALIANERLQYLFSSSTVVIYTAKASEDYRATSISENVTQITGYEAQEFIDESSFWFDHVHPEDQPIISSEVHKVFKTDLHSYEYRFQCKDRSYIWVRDEMKLVRNKDGNPIEIIGCWLDITKRKRAEEALRENDARYRLIAENVSDVIWVLDSENQTFKYVSPSIYHVLGFTDKEFLNRSLAQTVTPASFEYIKRTTSMRIERMLQGDSSYYSDEIEMIHKGGHIVPTEINMHFMKNKFTGLIECTGVMRDITERKQAEEEIRSAKSFIDRVVDMSPFAMWISDRKGTVIRTNRSLRETLNLPDDKIVGQYNVLKDENLEIQGVMPMVMAVFENHEPASFSIPWKAAKAGDVNFESAQDLYIDVSIFPIVSAEGELTNAVCQYVDITEHKKAEESLRESREKFKSIVDNIGIGVALISPAMEILEMNHKMREWFLEYDLDKRPICYRTFNNPPREEICEYCPTCKTLEDGKVHEGTTVTPQANKTRNYHIVSSPLINSQGEVTAAIEMVEDITESLNLQAQLIQAQKMESVGRLAGGVAHDYNNISSIIIGYSELALEKIEQSDPLHDDLMEIFTAAKRSMKITRQLLAFARQQTIAPKVLDLNDTIGNMLKMLHRLIGEDIDLAWLPGAKVWPVKIDSSQIDQILANLCVNARDAIAGVGKVTIETKNVSFDEDYCADHAGFVPGKYVLFAVSDDGSGMAPESLEKVFEPFFTTKDLGQGTGLGLATVYGIVKQNNGFINVYSEPEKGTTLKVYLPRHSGQAVEAHREGTLEIPLSRGETVLLVEDDGSILKLGKRILEDLGYTVLSTNSPSEATKLAEEHTGEINLLITDVVMPEMNGRELSEQLRTSYSNLKTLFMSGYTANVIAHRGVLEDGVCFMPKPFSKKDLAVKVREALDNDNS
ncbi:PAS domain S-box protein [Thermodesulfobacteriota bacterium]